MNSMLNSYPSCDAYYDLPEVSNGNEEINAEDFDPGEYVLDKKKTKEDSNEVEIPDPEKRKPGHKPTITGVYDDLYEYDTDPQISSANPDKTRSKDPYRCSKQRKIFAGSIIGMLVVGVIAAGVIFSLQGIYTFCIIKCM